MTTDDEAPSSLFRQMMRARREEAGISQAELARRMTERLGSTVDKSTVTRMETGSRVIRLDDAVAAADALGAPLMALIDPRGSGLDAGLDEAWYKLERAKKGLAAVQEETERRIREVEQLQRQFDELQSAWQVRDDAETKADLSATYDSERWPG